MLKIVVFLNLVSNLKPLLAPFAWLYGLAVLIRNKLYDWGFKSSKEFSIPVIGVGNLSAGGTGKTPHIEYLIRLLKNDHKLATLSRGYGRSGSGFLEANANSTSYEIGDEPKQYAQKFEDIIVAVDNNRVHGIKKLRELHPELNVILLDDAFQHRSVKPSLSIMLTDHSNMYYHDKLLPVGMLREQISGVARADVIIVTKTPDNFTPMEQRIILKEIKARPHQLVYFSYITYSEPISYWGVNEKVKRIAQFAEENYSVLMLTGIANPEPLSLYLKKNFKEVKEMRYSDHHEFNVVDLERIKAQFHAIPNEKKIIITTEKDAMRLDKPGLVEFIKGLPIVYLPIEVRFRDEGERDFDKCIQELMKR